MTLAPIQGKCPVCHQDSANTAFQAGAASRDAEVVSLTNQRDYEYVRAENAEQERDQLRAHINVLREALKFLSYMAQTTGNVMGKDAGLMDGIKAAEQALATPEQSLAASELRKELDALQADNAELVAALEAVIPEVAGGNAGLIAYNKCKAALAKVRKP